MKAKIANVLWMTCVILIIAASFAAAQTANTIVYQGKLTDAAGTAISANTNVRFRIYTGPSGGTAQYDTTASLTPDNNGVFTVELGPLSTTLMDGAKHYLGITVGADAEMTPRQVLTSAPSAHTACGQQC